MGMNLQKDVYTPIIPDDGVVFEFRTSGNLERYWVLNDSVVRLPQSNRVDPCICPRICQRWSASLDSTLEALRKDLRAELQLENDPEEKLLFLRNTPKTEE
jgi:hypothetical protein